MEDNIDLTEAILERIDNEASRLFRQDANEVKDTALRMLIQSVTLEKGMKLLKFKILLWFKDNWEVFDKDFTKIYRDDFKSFACKRTGLKWPAISNYMDTAKTFLDGEVGPSMGRVSIPLRDEHGKAVIDERGRVVEQIIDWNPTQPDISKLVAVKAAAKSGEMTPELWGMVMDSAVTVDTIQKELYIGNGDKDTPEIFYTLDGPVLTATRYGKTAILGVLDFDDYDTDDLTRESIDRILHYLHIKIDTDAIQTIMAYNDVVAEYKELAALPERISNADNTNEEGITTKR